VGMMGFVIRGIVRGMCVGCVGNGLAVRRLLTDYIIPSYSKL